jgi:hypothetical protein
VKKDATVTFRRYWRGRQPGQVVATLDYGVAELLVTRGIAAWGRLDNPLKLPRPEPVEVVAVTSYDAAGVEQAVKPRGRRKG